MLNEYRFDEEVVCYNSVHEVDRVLEFVLTKKDCEKSQNAEKLYRSWHNYFGYADVMTSYWTTFIANIRCYCDKNPNNRLLARARNGKWCVPNISSICKKYNTKDNKKIWAFYLKENAEFLKKHVFSNEACLFFSVNHTIGNFIPVSANFNSQRGRNIFGESNLNAEWDYWDLTLLAINFFYSEFKDTKSLFINDRHISTEKKRKIIEYWVNLFSEPSVKAWLSSFSGWDEFIEVNFLQDFVKRDIFHNSYGLPKMFWSEHSWTEHETNMCVYGPVPRIPKQFEQFYSNCSEYIIARNKRISRNSLEN